MILINRKNSSNFAIVFIKKCCNLAFYRIICQQKRNAKTSLFRLLVYKADSMVQRENV